MLKTIVIMVLFTNLIEGNKTLLWSEEFEENDLDKNVWFVKANRDVCEKQFSQRGKSCNSFKNYQLNNGSLKLLIKQEEYHGANFTGATIGTKKCFQDVRIEIRARKPVGVQLHAGLLMYAFEGLCGVGKYNGEIDIAKLRNNNNVWTSIHYAQWKSLDHIYHYSEDDIKDFHIYEVEWNRSHITWFIDQKTIFAVNRTHDQFGRSLNATQNPFYLPFDHSFNIIIHVGVGSFEGDSRLNELTDRDVQQWESPLLEIDYIRVFDNRSPEDQDITSRSSLMKITLSIVVPVILVICLVSIYLWHRRKGRDEQVQISQIYDDTSIDHTYTDYNYYGNVYFENDGSINNTYLEVREVSLT